MANLIVRPSSGTSASGGYGGGTWSNPANAYDTSTTTAATATISMWSQPTLTLNFSAIEIPERTVISRVTLNIIAASSAANLTAQVTINGGTTNIINQTITTANTNTTLTADITSYLESGISSLTIKGSASGYSNITFSVYDVYADVEYETYDIKVAEYKFDNSLYDLIPEFNEGYQYIYEDIVNGAETIRTIYSYSLPTLMRFGNDSGSDNRTQSLLKIDYLKIDNLIDMGSMFRYCGNVTKINASNWGDNNVVTNIVYMFHGCLSLTEIIGINSLRVDNCINFESLFNTCHRLKSIDISNWNTSKALTAYGMFANGINISSINLGKFDLNALTYGCADIFANCPNLKLISMNNSDFNSVNKIIAELPTRTTDSMGTLDIAGVDDISLVNINDAEAKFWNVEDRFKVAEYKFDNSLYDLFPEFNEGYQYTYEDVINGTETIRIIYSYSLPTKMQFGKSFGANRELSLLELMYANVSELTTMNQMFDSCSNMTICNTSNWDTSKVNDTCTMFSGCYSLISLDISSFNISNVTNMSYMFANCLQLTTLDLNNWNTSNVTNMDYMFYGCNSMITIDISNWDFSSVTSATNVLTACTVRKIICDNMTDGNLYTLYNVIPTADFNEFHTIHANNMSTTREQQFDSKYWYRYTDKTLVYYAYDNTIAGTYYPGATNITESEYTVTPVTSGNLTRVRIDSDTGRPTAIRFGLDCNPALNTASNAHEALLAVAHVKTDYITDMSDMFYKCKNLTQLDVYGWNTSNVTNVISMFRGCSSLTELDLNNWDTNNISGQDSMFRDCSNLRKLKIENWDTSNFTSFGGMFINCSSLTQLDLSNWNTSNVENMHYMFQNCSLLTQLNLSNWNTSKVTNMSYMFYGCKSLTELDLSNWNIGNVTDINYMFYECSNIKTIGNVSNWNTSKLTELMYVFNGCTSLEKLDVSNWDVSNVTKCDHTFFYCTSLKDIIGINNWDTSNLAYTSYMCVKCSSLERIDLSNWNTDSLYGSYSMFANCENLTHLNLSNWNLNNNANTDWLLYNSANVREVIMNDSDYNSVNKVIAELPQRTNDNVGLLMVTNVDDYSQINKTAARTKYWYVWENDYKIAEYKFDNTLYNLFPWTYDEDTYEYLYDDIVDGNITTRTYYCNKLFNHISFGWWDEEDNPTDRSLSLLEVNYLNIDALNSADCMFYNCTNLTYVNTSDWDTSKIESMYCMFYNCPKLTSIGDTSNWNTENVIDMYSMFGVCLSLTQLNVSNWNTSKVTDMSYMFYDCESLTSLDVSNWDTSEVLDMYFMFAYCYELTTLDVSKWDTSKVTDMADMFDSCYKLTSLNVSNWDTSNVTDMYALFYACESLTSLDLSRWDVSKVTDMSWMFSYYNEEDDTMALTSVGDLSNWNTESLTNISGMFCHCRHLTNLNVSNFDTSNVEYMSYVFRGCESLTSLDLSNWSTESATSLYEMFYLCYNLASIGDVSNWVTDNVTEMRHLFAECQSLISLDLSNWNIGNVTDLTWLFTRCYHLESIGDISNWNTSNVTDFDSMFFECDSLTSIDLSGWNTDQVTNMGWMFYGSDDLKELNLSGWNTNSVTYIEGILNDSPKLDTIVMNNSDSNSVNKIIANLPARTATEPGLIDVIGVDNASLVEKATAESKNWSVKLYKEKVAEYKFDNTLYDLFPEFNEGYSYDYEDVVEEIIINDFNWELGGIDGNTGENTEFSDSTIYRNGKYIEVIPNTIIRVTPNTGQLLIDWYDENKIFISQMDKSLVNEINVPDNAKYFRIWGGNIRENITELRALNSMITRTIYGEAPTLIRFGEVDPTNRSNSLLEVNYINTTNIVDMTNMFRECHALTIVESSDWNTSNVIYAQATFCGCDNLLSVDVSNWDMSHVTDTAFMFFNCQKLTSLDLNNWEPSNVIFMNYMFYNCESLTSIDVSNWDTSNVTDMSYMFYGCNNLTSLDVSNWDTSKVTDMSHMFQDMHAITKLDISNFDTSNVTTMEKMFNTCSNLVTLSGVENFKTSKVTSTELMFYAVDLKSLDLSSWDTSSMTITTGMFNSCPMLESLNLNGWNTNSIIGMSKMFYNCKKLIDLNISNWNLNNVSNINEIFGGTTALSLVVMNNSDSDSINKIISVLLTKTADNRGILNITNDLSQIDVATAESKYWDIVQSEQYKIVEYKFTNSSDVLPVFNKGFGYTIEDVVNGTTTTRTIKSTEFPTAISFEETAQLLEVYYLETSNMTSAYNLFYNCSGLTYVDLSHSDFSNIETIERMFTSCTSLVTIDGLNDLDISKVHNMGGIFSDCRKLTEINVSDWDVSKVTNFGAAFRRCYEITTIDLTKWNTKSAILMSGMFTSCTKLTSIDISGWNMTNVTTVNQMFYGCNKLTSVNLYNHLNEGVDTLYLFGNCSALVDIDIYNANYNTVNMIIDVLPTRTAAKSGMLRAVNVDNFSRLNVATAKSKYWGVFNKENNIVLQYKFDSSMCDLLPMFNDEFEYIYRDEYLDTVSTTAIHTENIVTYNRSRQITNFELTEADFDLIPIADNEIMTVEVDPANICTRTIHASVLPTGIYFGNEDAADNESNSLLEVLFVETKELNQIRFPYCESLKRIHDINGWDTSSITNMNGLFYNCKSLEDDLDLSNWVTDNVTNFGAMFSMCSSITSVGNLSTWNVSNSVSFNGLFTGAGIREFNASGWQFKKSTNTQVNFLGMFTQCSNLKKVDLSGWDFNDMFSPVVIYVFSGVPLFDTLVMNDSNYYSVNMLINDSSNKKKNLPLKTSDNPGIMFIGGVDDFSKVDVASANSQYWNVTGYVTAEYKFDNTLADLIPEFNEGFEYTYEDVVEENTVTRTIYSYELPTLIRFGMTGDGTDGETPVKHLSLLEVLDINYTNLTTCASMFRRCKNLTKINNINVTNSVTETYDMFAECHNLLELNADSFDTSNVTDMHGMFHSCMKLTELNLSSFDTSKVTNMAHMFFDCHELVSINGTSNWDTSKVLSMHYMFINCHKLSLLDVSNWNTSQVIYMQYMFEQCHGFTNLNVSNWKTNQVINMRQMFNCCISLKTLDLSNWDINKVTDIAYMFNYCIELESLNLSNWNINNAVIVEGMMSSLNKLNNVTMNNSDYNSVNKIIAQLPTRAIDNKGTLDIRGVDGLDQVNIATAQSKYWIIYNRHNDIISINLGNSKIDSVFAESGKKIKNIYLGDNKII